MSGPLLALGWALGAASAAPGAGYLAPSDVAEAWQARPPLAGCPHPASDGLWRVELRVLADGRIGVRDASGAPDGVIGCWTRALEAWSLSAHDEPEEVLHFTVPFTTDGPLAPQAIAVAPRGPAGLPIRVPPGLPDETRAWLITRIAPAPPPASASPPDAPPAAPQVEELPAQRPDGPEPDPTDAHPPEGVLPGGDRPRAEGAE